MDEPDADELIVTTVTGQVPRMRLGPTRASRSNFFSFRLYRDSVVDPLPRLHPRRRCVDVDGNINRYVHHSWLPQHELDNSSILFSCHTERFYRFQGSNSTLVRLHALIDIRPFSSDTWRFMTLEDLPVQPERRRARSTRES